MVGKKDQKGILPKISNWKSNSYTSIVCWGGMGIGLDVDVNNYRSMPSAGRLLIAEHIHCPF